MRSRLWLSLCLLHAVASMLVWWAGEPLVQLLMWRSDNWMQRPWTLWSTAWVHINTPHLIGNQLAVGALAVMTWLLRPAGLVAGAWLFAWPVSVLVLPWWPHIGYYAGLSGLIHAGVAVMAVHLLSGNAGVPMARRWGLLLFVGLTAKLVLEHPWNRPVIWDDGLGISIVTGAHLSGALVGAISAMVMPALTHAWHKRSQALFH